MLCVMEFTIIHTRMLSRWFMIASILSPMMMHKGDVVAAAHANPCTKSHDLSNGVNPRSLFAGELRSVANQI
jgi:hypothetical protein